MQVKKKISVKVSKNKEFTLIVLYQPGWKSIKD